MGWPASPHWVGWPAWPVCAVLGYYQSTGQSSITAHICTASAMPVDISSGHSNLASGHSILGRDNHQQSQPTSQPTSLPASLPVYQPAYQSTSQPTSLPASLPVYQPAYQSTSQPTSLPASQSEAVKLGYSPISWYKSGHQQYTSTPRSVYVCRSVWVGVFVCV